MKYRLPAVLCAFVGLASLVVVAQEQEEEPPEMGVFVTSVGLGDGANLGGLSGADAHCQVLAEAAGSEGKTWRAYLSTQAVSGAAAENAGDRIGSGPWHNAAGDLIGADIDDLHYNNANINYQMATDENGNTVNSGGMGDEPNRHDVLTGSKLDGTAFGPEEDRTCANWTSNLEGQAWVGHHDRFRFTTPGSPWNSVHPSRGCSQDQLAESGGAGLYFCFAAE